MSTNEFISLPTTTPLCEAFSDGEVLAKTKLDPKIKSLYLKLVGVVSDPVFIKTYDEFSRTVSLTISICTKGYKYSASKNDLVVGDLFLESNRDLVTKAFQSVLLKIGGDGDKPNNKYNIDDVKSRVGYIVNLVGTHIPKHSNSKIKRRTLLFKDVHRLSSGYNCHNEGDFVRVTGCEVNEFGAIGFFGTPLIINGRKRSVFDLIGCADEWMVRFLTDIFSKEVCNIFVEAVRSAITSECDESYLDESYKQNLIEYDGQMVSCSSVVAVQGIADINSALRTVKSDGGRVDISKFVVGGSNRQNVSFLNSSMGGSVNHIRAWFPRIQERSEIYVCVGRMNHYYIANELVRKCNGGSSAQMQSITDELLKTVSKFTYLYKGSNDGVRQRVLEHISPVFKTYLEPDGKADYSQACEEITQELLQKIKRVLQKNGFQGHLEAKFYDVIFKRLKEKGVNLCLSL